MLPAHYSHLRNLTPEPSKPHRRKDGLWKWCHHEPQSKPLGKWAGCLQRGPERGHVMRPIKHLHICKLFQEHQTDYPPLAAWGNMNEIQK